MIGKDLVAASATPLILSVLLGGESYGYEIIRQVRVLSGNRLDWSEGMIYPALRRLEEKGMLRSRWVESEAGPRRKYYSITRRGRAALADEKDAWMTIHSTLQALWTIQPSTTWSSSWHRGRNPSATRGVWPMTIFSSSSRTFATPRGSS